MRLEHQVEREAYRIELSQFITIDSGIICQWSNFLIKHIWIPALRLNQCVGASVGISLQFLYAIRNTFTAPLQDGVAENTHYKHLLTRKISHCILQWLYMQDCVAFSPPW